MLDDFGGGKGPKTITLIDNQKKGIMIYEHIKFLTFIALLTTAGDATGVMSSDLLLLSSDVV